MPEPARYLRPLPLPLGQPNARPLAGGALCFSEIEVLRRGHPPEILPADAVEALHPEAAAVLARLCRPRTPLAGIDLTRPKVMGVVNVTPDSFSDGGRQGEAAIAHALTLAEAGADILDIGGESTRPGAATVEDDEELARVLPVIEGLRARGCALPLSIDTRKARVAKAALAAGAVLFNDVSALTYDPDSLAVGTQAPALCLMHAQGTPETMQRDPRYTDVVLDVYDALAERLTAVEAAGIPRERVLIDPGIGFGKRMEHNLALIRRLSLLHALGAPVLLGASRKRFIGTLSGVEAAEQRVAGSLAAALAGAAQGAQVLRVHDVAETRQALAVWQALHTPD